MFIIFSVGTPIKERIFKTISTKLSIATIGGKGQGLGPVTLVPKTSLRQHL